MGEKLCAKRLSAVYEWKGVNGRCARGCLHVEYAERRRKYGILFRFSLSC